MSLNDYRILESVVEQRSFAKAAHALNLTPSAVSHAINKLEEDFGLPLFVRDRKGAYLTVDGERLMPYIRAVQQSDELLRQKVDQIHGLLRGTVRLASFNSVTVQWLPHILKSFRKEHPMVDIKIYQGGYDEIVSWLGNNTVDLAFVVNDIAPDMEIIPLHRDRLICITPHDYVPLHKDYITIEDMKRMNLILQRDGYNTEMLDFFERNHMRVNSSFYVETDEAIVALVEAGLGYCILSDMIFYNPNAEVKAYPIIPGDYRTIGLAMAKRQNTAPATMKMRKTILEFAQRKGLMNLEEE